MPNTYDAPTQGSSGAQDNGSSGRHTGTLLLAALLAALIFVGGAALSLAGSFRTREPESPARFIELTVTVQAGESEERSYELVTATDRSPLSLATGSRVPIPGTSIAGEGGSTQTTYQYQDIGFETELTVIERENGQLRIEGKLEDSRLSGSRGSGGLPIVEHHSHQFRGLLDPDAPTEVTSLTGSDGEPYRITIYFREL